jgi:amino acid adenylation domain-containing protein
LALRTRIDPRQSFNDLLQQVKQHTLEAYAHQDLPFERLVDHLRVERSLSHTPLFQVMLVLQNNAEAELGLDGLEVLPQETHASTANFDLTLTLTETQDGLYSSIEYASALFDEATIRHLIEHWQILLKGIADNPAETIHRLPMLSPEERRQILVSWNDTRVDYPEGKTIPAQFEEQAAKTPDATALVFEGQSLTYRQLNEKANQVAHYLIAQKLKPGALVTLCFERSTDMLIAILATLKAGCAYVPLDPDYPDERLEFMIQDAKSSLLITQTAFENRFKHKSVILDKSLSIALNYPVSNPAVEISPIQIACVIYTSGSTGVPKGVEICHASMVNHVRWYHDCLKINVHDRSLQFASFAFDTFGAEVWPFLLAGACVMIPTLNERNNLNDLASFIVDNRLTVIDIPVAIANSLLNQLGNQSKTLRLCKIGGEALLSYPDTKGTFDIWNIYGPTECTIDACGCSIKTQGNGRVPPIGRPVSNTSLYILNEKLSSVGIGMPGELYISGAGLARGYLNRPDLTAERFIANPFSQEPGARMYKTGDQCRYLADGNIEYLGRMDFQVKIRGFRIELGEIEAALHKHPDIRDAVVLAREDAPGDKRLVAWLVAQTPEIALQAGELRQFLKETLPDYMIPAAFVFLDAMPLTPNGKLDRKALPEIEYKASQVYVAPRNKTEEVLCEQVRQLLHAEKVGVHDNFFELGGHSLLATQLITNIQRDLHVTITLRALFNKPTVEGLAECIAGRSDSSYIPVQAVSREQLRRESGNNPMNKTKT